MAYRGAKSIVAAEKRALAGQNESQDSQAALVNLMIIHGVGVHSSSPVPGDDDLPPSIKEDRCMIDSKTTGNYSEESQAHAIQLPQHHHQHQDASNAFSNPTRRPDAAANSIHWEANEIPTTNHVAARDEVLLQIRRSSAPLRKTKTKTTTKAHNMSSQSPTQSNEDRSYEQYTNEASQLQSTQSSSLHEHRTLHEHDTGFLDFNAQLNLPDTAPTEHDTNGIHEAPDADGTPGTHNAPETPAVARLFAQEDNEPLMGPSQLFGQTQWTSALKKASPTSSRPSPHLFNHNTISPNHAISSPLKDRGLRTSPTDAFVSSPSAFPDPSPRPSDSKDSPTARRGHETDKRHPQRISETPPLEFKTRKTKKNLEPISEYKPFRRESEESDAAQCRKQGGDLDSDFEEDEAEYRRRRAKLKKEQASRSFPPVTVIYPSSDKATVEVPSTSRTEPRNGPHRTNPEQYIEQCYGRYPTDNDGSQETVADSQDVPARQKSVEAVENMPNPPEETNEKPNDDKDCTASSVPADDSEYKETIPETSPPATLAEPPRLISDILNDHSSGTTGAAASSFPAIFSSTGIEQEKQLIPSERENLDEQGSSGSLVPNHKPEPTKDAVFEQSSPSLVLESSQQGSTRRSTRLKIITTPLSTSPNPPTPSDAGTRTSSLTNLSATPDITPTTAVNSENELGGHVSSPAVAKASRRGRLRSLFPGVSSLSKVKTYSRSKDTPQKTARPSPYSSSADELARSPSLVSSVEGRKPVSRKGARQSLANHPSVRESMLRHGIFEGMVFAISFQEQPKSQRNREKHMDRNAVERMIRQEGGRILPDGFNTLFTFDSVPTAANVSSTFVMSNSLKLLDQETGFTALIADGHSRKVKYMQALALGIPCLAPRWVTTCVSRRAIVDWSSYLLCAGPSALLGDAIRSRNLQPYDAPTAKLADVIRHRPKLLEESRILLVMKKNSKNEEKRLPYVFLAQVLGAMLVRVHSLEEARARLRQGEAEDEVFDWVYVDDRLHDAQTALFGGPGSGVSKKRKRQSAGAGDSDDRPPKRIRTLNDELVIQSLILGRLIEEGELED